MARTKQEHVGFVGYSLAAMSLICTMAYHDKYNDILKPAIILGFGTVSRERYDNNAIIKAAGEVLRAFPGPFAPKFKLTSAILTAFCSPPLLELCVYIMGIAAGSDPENLNKTRLPVYMSQMPAGSSTWTLAHLQQQSQRASCLSMFDYGQDANLKKYGQKDAPCYDLARIRNRYIGARG
ncbi:Lipase member N [Halotydeus destructor]|nr:Lipase member N [Halotydeus destructor]